MRSLADRDLSEPYGQWIDRAVPLPPGVVLVPRTVDVGGDALVLVATTLPMGAVSIFFLLLASRVRPEVDGWAPYLLTLVSGLALWIAPVVLLRRLSRTIGASRDRARGALRQGIFVGAEGALVRMEPDRCHPIPAARFVSATRVGPLSTAHARRPMVEVETLDGTIKLFADRLDGDPGRIAQAAGERWPAAARPRRRPKARVKGDPSRTAGLKRAARILGWSVVALFVALGLLRLAGASWSSPVVKATVVGLLLLVAGAALHIVVQWVRMRAFYRCPRCGGTTSRVPATLPALRYACRRCNVEWDTGLEERAGGDA